MRKILVLAFLGAACAVASFFPLQKSGAQKVQRQDVRTDPRVVNTRTLPDFDIRLGDTGEFVDEDVSSTSIKQSGLRSSKALARASAVVAAIAWGTAITIALMPPSALINSRRFSRFIFVSLASGAFDF